MENEKWEISEIGRITKSNDKNKSKVTWITKMDTFTPSRRFKKNLRYR